MFIFPNKLVVLGQLEELPSPPANTHTHKHTMREQIIILIYTLFTSTTHCLDWKRGEIRAEITEADTWKRIKVLKWALMRRSPLLQCTAEEAHSCIKGYWNPRNWLKNLIINWRYDLENVMETFLSVYKGLETRQMEIVNFCDGLSISPGFLCSATNTQAVVSSQRSASRTLPAQHPAAARQS